MACDVVMLFVVEGLCPVMLMCVYWCVGLFGDGCFLFSFLGVLICV